MARFGSDAPLAATKKLAELVRLHATVMSIADVFTALTFLFLFVALLAPLMRRPAPGAGGGGH